MPKYEFKIVSAPSRSARFSDLDRGEDPFNRTLETLMNDLAVEGWEFLRSESLPVRRRSWILRKIETSRDLLVFRRERRPLGNGADARPEEIAKARPRRVRSVELVEFVREGGRRISPEDGEAKTA